MTGEPLAAAPPRATAGPPVPRPSLHDPERFGEVFDAHFAEIHGYAAKRLGPDLLERLVTHPSCGNPLFLRTVVDELRQHGDHFTLGEVLDHLLAAPDLVGLFERVTARWERDFERDRPGLVGDALGLLASSRRGLAEAELLDLLTTRPEPLPSAVWSPLRPWPPHLLRPRRRQQPGRCRCGTHACWPPRARRRRDRSSCARTTSAGAKSSPTFSAWWTQGRWPRRNSTKRCSP